MEKVSDLGKKRDDVKLFNVRTVVGSFIGKGIYEDAELVGLKDVVTLVEAIGNQGQNMVTMPVMNLIGEMIDWPEDGKSVWFEVDKKSPLYAQYFKVVIGIA